ncbi:MAG: glycosyltransferase family 2 protein [Chloroflexi bacterium]|nr:glycosyltransferase family 2 protein [Chloroflexota bacterium]
MTPRLSVLIPTYRRPHYLSECLGSVLRSGGDQPVEIIVSDNASPDETSEVVASFADRRIRYYRNSNNLGPEVNILRLLEYAQGEWIFFLTDDDLMNPNCVLETMRIVQTYPQVAVIISALNMRDDLSGRVEWDYAFHPSSRLFSAGGEALESMFMACHIISRLTIRRDLLDIDGYKRQIGRHLYSPVWLPAYAMKIAGCYYTNERLITHRVNNSVHWEYSPDYMTKGLIDLVYELLPEPENAACARHLREYLVRNTLWTLYSSRAASIQKFAQHVRALLSIREVRTSMIFWRNLAMVLPMALVPNRLVQMAAAGIKRTLLRRREWGSGFFGGRRDIDAV